MKHVLDYSKEELENLSLAELNALHSSAEDGENEYNTRQLVEKVLMNSLYGALANKHFLMFNEEMAAAITGNGRYFIRKLSIYIEKKLQSMLKSEKPYIIYGDTDSFLGDTEVDMNNLYKITYEDREFYVSDKTKIKTTESIVYIHQLQETDIIEEIIYENGKCIRL